ncbi:MAG: BolA/IbaG family iron-sulfur metabolism protein [Arsenophonus sp.]|nr:MAG: BolA/IbaG family iron-sulfur metabolism protein [Arsenophonus sp.]
MSNINNISTKIKTKLTTFFLPVYLVVKDESMKHNFSKNMETHFKIILVTEKFIQQKLLKRHRIVYLLLEEELSNGVHALEIHTYTPIEWKRYQYNIKNFSIPCLKKIS